jgi:ABC-type bacteriocin/lantibiotic exporter with double-glycine peptidase domain
VSDPRSAGAILRELVAASPSAVVLSAVAGAVALVPGLAVALLIRTFLNQYLIAGAVEWGKPVLIGLAAATVVAAVLAWLQYRMLQRFAVRLSATRSTSFVWHVLRLPVPVVDRLGAGDLMARGSATQRLAFQASMLVLLVPANVLKVVVFSVVLVVLDPILGATAVGVVLVSMLVSARLLAGRTPQQQRADRARVEQTSLTSELVGGIETVKANAAEQWVFDRWSRARDAMGRAVSDLGAGGQRLGTVAPFTPTVGLGAVLAVGVWLVLGGSLSLGTLVAAQALLLQVLIPAGQLVWLGVLLSAVVSVERQTGEVCESPLDPEVADDAGESTAAGPAVLQLRDLTFGYDRDGAPVLQGVDLDVPAGARVALVGESGGGKSTLVRLVIGELQPWSGEVLIDGVPRLDVPREARTGSLAYVPQTPVLVPGTIRENITLFDPDVPEEVVLAAVRDACIGDAVAARPRGLDEEVSGAGDGFSGGELQRLAIAQALCRRPRLLVLDEATSALDPVVEAEVEHNLRSRACTCLVVAHRLSTVRDADRIVVLDEGVIVQQGAYDELKTHGRFSELVHG